MTYDFSAAIKRAAESSPQRGSRATLEPGRVLLADGDGLAYYCAGNDDCLPGQARVNLLGRLREAQAAAGAESVRVLVTAQGSNKGHRYAVARVYPYQGKRDKGRRPKNWHYLRQLLEAGFDDRYPVDLTGTAEADDLFGRYATAYGAENVVHYTQDKDMRMIPGWHMEWKTLRMTFVPEGTFEHTFNDLLYGRKWFWMQMLHGDDTDHIPGLPRLVKPDGKEAKLGKVTAAKLLADCKTDADARATVVGLYRAYYPDDYEVQLLEQGILLWMRRDFHSGLLDVMSPGNPLDGVIGQTAVDTVFQRIEESA